MLHFAKEGGPGSALGTEDTEGEHDWPGHCRRGAYILKKADKNK